MKMLRDRNGISPIVGVILVVAMTIMLGIIAWNYLGEMASGGPSRVYQVGVVAKQIEAEKISVTYVGGPDKDKLVELRFSGVNSSGKDMSFYLVQDASNTARLLIVNTSGVFNETGHKFKSEEYQYIPIGLEVRTNNATLGRDHVVVVAVFSDGTEQIIYDDYF